MKLALIYDDQVRSDTTGTHCLRALQALPDLEVRRFGPQELERIPARGFDLYLHIDDGLQYRLPEYLHPCAWWVIDTHMSYEWDRLKAQDFDHVFAAQRDGAQWLIEDGIEGAQWLPLACLPAVHRRHEVEKVHDVCFVGNLVHGERERLIDLLRREFPNTFVGQAYGDAMALEFSRSRIVFNRSVKNDVNMRVFEAVACGSLLVTNALTGNGQQELFRSGEHLVTYSTDVELLERVRYYLEHEDEREAIAACGMAHAHACHTYTHRMKHILEVAASAPVRAVGRPRLPVYFQFPRPELLELIPSEAQRVLDVGCGAGRLGVALKRRQPCEVTGVEIHPEAAAEAARRLDRVLTADVESPDLDLGDAPFDCIVLGDVLEHLREPGTVLKRLAGRLAPEGVVVASVPNIRNCRVIQALANGFFSYEPAGVLDATHLRFFGQGEALDLFARSGLEVTGLYAVHDPQIQAWRSAGSPATLQLGMAGLSFDLPEQAEELFVEQYLLTARPKAARPRKLASIIILAWNEVAYTRMCIESVQAHTSQPYELILVDNGSIDGTPDYLATVHGAQVIRNEENLGFPKGVNQGIQAASGDYVLLLNNDTLVTEGWLDRLTACAESADDVGMVGPYSNYVVGDQLLKVPYTETSQLPAFAARLAWRNRGRAVETMRLIGFCLLIKRSALERVGLLDEAFGIGTFEDDDLSMRMRMAGYRLLIAEDAFVHHFGSRTFIGQGVDTEGLLEGNFERFRTKWGLGRQAEAPQPARREGSPRISLCMIVRDEERNIAQCLNSIRPWVDEMIVVDTGSKDRTEELARACGARVEHFAWCDSFSAARNESLRHATGDWIFWMDADDVIDETNGARLRELVEQAPEDVFAYTIRVHCLPRPGEETGIEVVDHVKLFRNHPDLRFEFRMHEQILPSVRRLGKQVAYTDAFVTHAGYDTSPEGQQRKRERDMRLLRLDLEEHPDHPFVHFNLGMTAYHTGEPETAVRHLRRSIELAEPGESHLRKAYALLCGAHRRLEQYREARQACEEGLAACPGDTELLFSRASVCHEVGDLTAAEESYRAILNATSEGTYLRSVDVGLAGYKTRHNLAMLYLDQQRTREAAAELRLAVTEEPGFIPSWMGLTEISRREGRLRETLELARRLCSGDGLAGLPALLEARAAYDDGQLEACVRIVRQAISGGLGMNLGHARRLESHALLRLGRIAEAVPVLRELLHLVPQDEEAQSNLRIAMQELRSAR